MARSHTLGFRDIKDIRSLTQLRDELTVQASLFKAEALERWTRLHGEIKPVQDTATRSALEVADAAKALGVALRHGYDEILASVRAVARARSATLPEAVEDNQQDKSERDTVPGENFEAMS